MEIETGQIVKLYIPHFKKERYYLVYKTPSIDFILVNITDRDKRESAKTEINQHKLRIEINSNIISLVNLNTEVIIDYELFSELIDKLPQQNKKGEPLPKISQQELDEITEGVEYCFNNEKFRGNRYRVRVE